MKKGGYVYIVTNEKNTVLYTGVTNNLERRIYEHKTGKGGLFTRKYKCTKLVYFGETDSIQNAIEEEKRIKSGSRKNKVEMIQEKNPIWKDLSEGWFNI